MRIGFVPLIDAAPLIVAHERGFFQQEGLEVTLLKQIGWANVRDKLTFGQLDASHALVGMPLMSQLGRDSFMEPLVEILRLGAGGSAITLGTNWYEQGIRSAAELAFWLRRNRNHRALIFGHVFGCSTHHYLLREWLAGAGIDPDREVRLCIIPPSQIAEHMAKGYLDGFCVGEPWNTLAESTGIGRVVARTSDIAPGHPDKIVAVSRRWLTHHADELERLIRALLRSTLFCSNPANHEAIAELLSRSEYIGQVPALIAASLPPLPQPALEPAAAAKACVEATFPSKTHVAWMLDKMIQWRQVAADLDPHALAAACCDTGAYRQAAQSLELACPRDDAPDMPLSHGRFFRMPAAPGQASATPQPNLSESPADPATTPLLRSRAMKSTRVRKPDASRRALLKIGAATAVATLLAGVPRGWQGAAWAADGPETADLNFGMIALTDCSPIVIAHELGLFKKYGINSKVTKGANWAAIRDGLSNGDIQATHMLLGMPIASTLGLLGSPKRPMIVPWLLNRNGQCISLKTELKGKVAGDPKTLKPIVDAAKAAGNKMTFAMTFPPGTHAMWMRYFLAAGGIHPDQDVSLIVVPPAQMVANMKIGKMDGFCVGEPWNARVIADQIGFTAVSTQDMWPDHPEKVCAFLGSFADKNPRTVKAVLKALHEASVWLDDLKNRPVQCEIVARATYINCPKELILGRLQGHYDYGDGRTKEDSNYMIFSARNCNYPQYKYAVWFLTQYRRWGMIGGGVDYAGVARQVMRPDIYEEAMKEIGYVHGGADHKPEKLFDGVTFDPAQPEAYATGFAVHNLKA
ncbi:MAG: CmpA/NrtA family ABC transporter substrate-binding protein [Phycisphaerae bacterium]